MNEWRGHGECTKQMTTLAKIRNWGRCKGLKHGILLSSRCFVTTIRNVFFYLTFSFPSFSLFSFYRCVLCSLSVSMCNVTIYKMLQVERIPREIVIPRLLLHLPSFLFSTLRYVKKYLFAKQVTTKFIS